MLPADYWWTVAQAVVTAIEDGYTADGAALPTRRLVTPGQPTFDFYEGDDGLLAVQLERTFSYAGNLASEIVEPNERAAAFALRGATYAVWLMRCVPSFDNDGHPPSVDDEEASAQLIYTDSTRLLNVLLSAVRDGDLGGCRTVAFENWQSQVPSGGYGGGVLRVRIGA